MLSRLVARYNSLPQGGRWAIGLAGILVVFNLFGLAIEAVYGGAPSGPPSSTFTTDGGGTAAYAELLERNDKTVVPLREEPARADLPSDATLFVLSPQDVAPPDVDALQEFVAEGGRLVVAVEREAEWLRGILPGPPIWTTPGTRSARALVPIEETRGVETVSSAGAGAWETAGETLPILAGELPAATVATVGEGRVVSIADATLLQNSYLDEADNADFALAIAGQRDQMLFAETYHGYSEATGFTALPESARWALALLGVAVLLAMLAYGRRFGPPDRIRREFPPTRRAYVDALAGTLGKMRDREAVVAPLRKRGRAALAKRLNVSDPYDDPALLEAARRHGLEKEAEVLVRPVTTDDDVVYLGRTAIRSIRGTR